MCVVLAVGVYAPESGVGRAGPTESRPVTVASATALHTGFDAGYVARSDDELRPDGSEVRPASDGGAGSTGVADVIVRLVPAVDSSGPGTGGSDVARERLDEALLRFRDAGLLLPDLAVVFHHDSAPCKGHDGLFQPQFSPWRVLVCSEADFVLTHELAHAWERANLDDADRDRYLDHRGLDAWAGDDVEWRDRGVEDAAFMLQQNLMMRPASVDTERWIERLAAYEVLTGNASPIVVEGGRSARR